MRNKIFVVAIALVAFHGARLGASVTSGPIAGTTKYAKTFFAPATATASPVLYVAAPVTIDATKKAFTVASITQGKNADGSAKVTVTPLAPEKTTLNDQVGVANPLFGEKISHLTLCIPADHKPVVAVGKKVYVITNGDDGSTVGTHDDGVAIKVSINDAAGNAIDKDVVAMAVSDLMPDTKGFGAVAQMGKTWGADDGTDRGIAVLAPDAGAKFLEVFDATDFSIKGAVNKARKTELRVVKDNFNALDLAAVQALTAQTDVAAGVGGVNAAKVASVATGVLQAMTNEVAAAVGGNPAAVSAAVAANDALALTAGLVGLDVSVKAAATIAINAAIAAVKADVAAAAAAGGATVASTKKAVEDLEADFNYYDTKATAAAAVDIPAVQAAVAEQAFLADKSNILTSFVDHGVAPAAFAKIADTADMFWNRNLDRLYVGLSTAKRDANDKEAGILGMFMGRIDEKAAGGKGALVLQPVVSGVKKDQFYDAGDVNSIKRVVGFYADGVNAPGTKPMSVTVNQIRALQTPTIKDYLIVNSLVDNGIGGGGNKKTSGVFALPVWPVDAKFPEKTGTIVKVNANGVADFANLPVKIAEMPEANQKAVQIVNGAVDSDNLDPASIQDIFVVGDTVYMCAASGKQANSGVFASTALLNKDGVIHAWTSPQRVFGSLQQVTGAGFDDTMGNFYALTNPGADVLDADPTNINTARITQWGKGTGAVGGLQPALDALFPIVAGGVHQIFTFDEFTPGFGTAANPTFSAMVAVGLDRVAIIKTAQGATFPVLTPTADFAAADTVFMFQDNAAPLRGLDGIGPVSCAEFARTVAANSGWLFVGGYNGVSVLRIAGAGGGAGNGFASQAPGLGNLTDAAYPGDAATWTFKKLVPSVAGNTFDHTRKLVCAQDPGGVAANQRLYVMTEDSLYEIAMAANKFRDVGPNPLAETLIASAGAAVPAGSNQIPADAALTDMVVIRSLGGADGFRALLATSKGLFRITNVGGGANVIAEIPINGVTGLPIVQLQYLSAGKGTPDVLGNLYVLVADMAHEPSSGRVYRFAVNADAATAAGDFVMPIPENPLAADKSFANFGEFRGNMFPAGSVLLHAKAKHFDDTNYLNLNSVAGASSSITDMLAIDRTTNSLVGSPIRDNGSGALIIPGDWGVRVNQ